MNELRIISFALICASISGGIVAVLSRSDNLILTALSFVIASVISHLAVLVNLKVRYKNLEEKSLNQYAVGLVVGAVFATLTVPMGIFSMFIWGILSLIYIASVLSFLKAQNSLLIAFILSIVGGSCYLLIYGGVIPHFEYFFGGWTFCIGIFPLFASENKDFVRTN